MRRRQVLATAARLAALAPVAMLAACGALPSVPGTPLKRAPASIRLAYGPYFSGDAVDAGDKTLIPPIVDAFHQANPEITVDAVQATSFQAYRQQFFDPSAGSHADVVVTRNWGANSPLDITQLISLDPLVKRDRDVTPDGFYPQALHRLTVQGHLLGLPRDVQPSLVIFYNLDLFKEAGASTPSDGWTNDEFLQTCQQISAAFASKPEKALHYPLALGDQIGVLYDFITSQGGRPIDPASGTISIDDSVVAGIQFYADLYSKHHVLASSVERAGAYSSTTPLPDFLEGKVPMLATSTDLVAFLRTAQRQPRWDVATLPSKADVKQAWQPAGSLAAITKASTQQDIAWQLAKYLAVGPGMAKRAAVGDLHPADKKLATSDAWLNKQPPDHRSLFNGVGVDRLLDPDPFVAFLTQPTATPRGTVNTYAMFRAMSLNLDDLASGKMTARQFAQEAANAANAPLRGR